MSWLSQINKKVQKQLSKEKKTIDNKKAIIKEITSHNLSQKDLEGIHDREFGFLVKKDWSVGQPEKYSWNPKLYSKYSTERLKLALGWIKYRYSSHNNKMNFYIK